MDTTMDAIIYKFRQQVAVGNHIKCLGKIQEYHINMVPLICHHHNIMNGYDKLSVTRVTCTKAVLAFYQDVLGLKMC